MRLRSALSLTAPLALVGVLLVRAPAISYAEPCEFGEHVGNPHCDPAPGDPPPATTPELGSSVLFGVGALALGGVVWRRRRPAN
jgi:hypothetical protein